ncbi:RNA polymerase sigma-70 factor [Chitinophaga nivalis]|uniref:RNA polymerase sigma-70 factor n=1 Tax=Chitinophaga nivalis TaxID=2991709 RepID=A0ABT3IL91_9BACT|nr:RNA polymerase sigma-70 factor [Chitinophaga nivalis]MCW3465584.1 RNA polymerase sigma-70 factor [Chitinophaga nivalis]MCW3484725.1 RNA polymerase sigma-70 factor [Chitinophaga nivalis]
MLQLSNEEIVKGIRQRNKSVFEAVFKQYAPTMYNIAVRYVKQEEDANDMVQDVFLNLWKSAENLDERAPINHYLARATVNTCLNRIKKEQRKDVYVKEQVFVAGTGAAENNHALLEHKELEARYRSALDKLPDQCRRVFELSRLKGLSPAEIAEQLNISINTVYAHLTTALKKLRVVLINKP